MKKSLLIMLLSLFVFTSCGDDDESVVPTAPVVGESPSEAEPGLLPVDNACDLFSVEHNDKFEFYKGPFSRDEEKCLLGEALNPKREQAMMKTYAFAEELFGSFNSEVHQACPKMAKQFLKKTFQNNLRALQEENETRAVRSELTKVSLDNVLRRAMSLGCISTEESYSFTFNDENVDYHFNDNFIMNGSFEHFRVQGERGFKVLGREWSLVSSKFVPGWKVKALNPVEGKDCNFFEFQGGGLVTPVENGNHIVELKSHCKNEEGQNVGGDARVEISHNVFVKNSGDYKLIFKAQKRAGVHGKLEVAAYQRKRDKEFHEVSLSNQAQWQDICIDVQVVEEQRAVRLALRDNEEGGHQSMGILLDDISFSEGSCE